MDQADEDSKKKFSIINSILSLESKTNGALRCSRDEIDRLEIVTANKKSEVQKLEDELNALLHGSKEKKSRMHKISPKTLRRRTISGAGNHVSEELIRRSVSSGCINISKRSEQESISATAFTVQTFEKSDEDKVSLWTSFQNDEDAASLEGRGCGGRNDGGSPLNFDVCAAKESVFQMETLLTAKTAQLDKYKQKYGNNAKKLHLMQQQLYRIQRQQSVRCEEHKSNIQALARTKIDSISRIRWRENRILEEEKNLAELKRRLTAAKSEEKSLRQGQDSTTFLEVNDDDHKELLNLTTQCADLLTEFSSSIFKMIKSTISLPSHSSISFSIGDPSDTSIADSTNKQKQLSEKSSFSLLSTENSCIKLDEQQKLDELQKLEEHYDANIKMMQDEIESLQCAHNEEIEMNKAVLDNLENQIASLNEGLLKKGYEVRRLVDELEIQNK